MADLTLAMEVTTESRRGSVEDPPKESVVKQEDELFNAYHGLANTKIVINADPLKVEGETQIEDLHKIFNLSESISHENPTVTDLVDKIKQEEFHSEDSLDDFIVEREPRLELNTHPCPSCSKTFKQLGYLHRHLKTMHNITAPTKNDKKSKHQKSKSLAQLKTIKKAKKHKLKSPKKKSMKSVKAKTFKKKIKVEASESGGETEENANKEFVCDLCGHQCTDAAQLERHKRSHSSEKPYSCDHCSYSSKQKSALDEHKKIHGIQDFACLKCGLSFDSERRLSRHSLMHKKNHKKLSCDICDFSGVDKTELRKHKSEHHSKENTLTCEICGFQTNRPSSFRTHKLTHERHLSFSCGVCKYTCLTLANMKKHVYIHTDEKPFKCHMCDKTFKSMEALKRHVKTVHFRSDDPAAPPDWSNSDHE